MKKLSEMKEQILIIGGGLLFIIFAFVYFIYHYEEPKIIFEGETRTISDVEEIISDRIESENPSLDLEVSISEENDD
ncbi:hypothetical protein [Bacillus andreraoultii]|uniref:hypothetical protein n=1 Tax=Bacillus andreraoultii TaxID=1499685 RepID=UPI00053AB69E|nr:hypothetical protein [Bacillus andreraoultii]